MATPLQMVPPRTVLRPRAVPPAVAVNLGSDVVRRLRQCAAQGKHAVLLVENGRFSLRIDSEVYPCAKAQELLRLDTYVPDGDGLVFAGTVASRLTVVEPKTATEPDAEAEPKEPVKDTNDVETEQPTLLGGLGHADRELGSRFIALLALGPMAPKDLAKRLHADEPLLEPLIASHAQLASKGDAAEYPGIKQGLLKPDHLCVVLKDKAYKELKPWLWSYTAFERRLVLRNAAAALSRMGFSETHPLRKRLLENNPVEIKKATLGGGLLTKKLPSRLPVPPARKKLKTESPTKEPKEAKETKDTKDTKEHKELHKDVKELSKDSPIVHLPLSASSDDEKKKRQSYTLPSSINDEEPSDMELAGNRKRVYYRLLALKFKAKYSEYQLLYTELRKGKTADRKKKVTKLCELHATLAEWKRRIWDYHNDTNMAQSLMLLSRHRKTPLLDRVNKPVHTEKKKVKKALDY